MTIKYEARGKMIVRMTNPYPSLSEVVERNTICSIEQAAEAWNHMLKGPPICKERGDHDFSVKVAQTSNMYLCFRCGEPGWMVPFVDA